ncbi:hypothetical protein C8R46DRAFT_1036405 [Mycena filopes]|nr:hypothetical protein C8R46DRAFT_1036405 [Mycena filopes]
MDWGKRLNWFRLEHFWTNWIPVVLYRFPEELPWYYIEYRGEEVVPNNFGGFVVEAASRETWISELQQTRSCILEFRKHPLFPTAAPVPAEFKYKDLFAAQGSDLDARILVASSKRKMLEQLGFIAWWTTVCSSWDRNTPQLTIDVVRRCALECYGKRGVLIDLSRDFTAINLPLLLCHEVPFVYPWTEKEAVDPRFSRFSPVIWRAYPETKRSLGNDFLALDEDTRNSDDYHLLYHFNQFLDEKPVDSDLIPSDVPVNELRKAWALLYVKRYIYRMFGDTSRNDATVVFYWYQPLERRIYPSKQYRQGSDYDAEEDAYSASNSGSSDDGSSEDREDPVIVRELSRIVYAPRHGQCFDPDTGYELEKPWTGATILCRAKEVLDKGLPSTDDPDYIGTRDAVERMAKLIAEGVPDRMDVDPAGSQASPPPESSPIPPSSQLSASPVRWNSVFITKSYLMLPEAASRVRARYWVITNTGIADVKGLLDMLIEHGVKFNLAVKDTDFAMFCPTNILHTERTLGSAVYSRDVREDPFEWGSGGKEFVTRWSRRTSEILKREDHARVMGGPSNQVTLHQGGTTDIQDEDYQQLVWDELSAAETDILLGKVDGVEKYVYPTNEILWDVCKNYSGAFNPAVLEEFEYIRKEIARNSPQQRSKTDFRNLFRDIARNGNFPPPPNILHNEFDAADAASAQIFADSWRKTRARGVFIPGIFKLQ